MEIPKNIKDEIWEYCRLNDITDLNAFMLKSLQQGFNIEKYGPTPFTVGDKEPEIIEKEIKKIVEVVKEVPVEVIKEVFISDDKSVNKLQKELKEKDDEIETLNQKISDLTPQISQLKSELNELGEKTAKLEKQLGEEREKVLELSESDESIRSLTQQIENLKIELELEKNRHYQPPKKEKPKEDKPKSSGLGNIINWVSKSEREDKDIYNE